MNIDMVMSSHAVLALITSGAIGAVAGYIGSLMVTKRLALMGGALGHLTLPGISLGLLFGFDVSVGAFFFLLAGMALIWGLERYTGLSVEALTAVVFAVCVATAFLFLPKGDTNIALLGDISKISPVVAGVTLVLTSVIYGVIQRLFSGIILIGISEDLAYSENINPTVYNGIFLACIAIVVALGVRIVGGLMTAALVSIPACTSRNISTNLFSYRFASLVFGLLSCLLGVLVGLVFALPIGPMIIVANGAFFVASLFFVR